MDLDELDTPSLVVDLDALERNIGEMAAAAGAAGARLRPHTKTHKAPEIARMQVEAGAAAPTVHSREVFGPVATVVPYSGSAEDAAGIVARGGGGLVSSVYSEDVAFTSDLVLGLAPYHGRVFLGSAKIAEASPGPGTVLPLLVHGGPGRAGGGEELGGLRGLGFYLQRVALEGSRPVIDRITGVKGS
jgi:oxepin-CoA hydrolase/3-oxo-5,6-dehydrosuberyl-CoA semialdehyde dehydrogenase